MRQDQFMFMIAVLAVLIMGILLALAILYPNNTFSKGEYTTVVVSASGTSYALPENAVLYVTMNGTGKTAAIAAANLSLTLSQFNYTVLKYTNNDSGEISTLSYSLHKQYNGTGYVAEESLSVYLPSIDTVNQLLSTLSFIKNVYIDQISAQLSQQQVSEMTKNALTIALQNATSQAEILSNNSTLSLKNITVSEQYRIYPYVASTSNLGGENQFFFEGRQGVTESVTAVFNYR